ncbi:SH3 domain-containing protein [Rhodophyticola sp. CCM32]|uniref:SH3 domain-containing protein n=1 Tax=Rhodophyticola sp. CCM32 TaxID=2916397 RepID=UPI00107F72D7|nr:SH3 domain-containing protein [Rhodophyticola sp. CCM32]QBY02316.1 SH3 domain-containing protein [Rhodophyticola sp. CCM32]
MIRLTLLLCAIIYSGMIIFSDPATRDVETPDGVSTRAEFDPSVALPTPHAPPVPQIANSTGTAQVIRAALVDPAPQPPVPDAPVMTLTGPDGEIIAISAVIRPSQAENEIISLTRPAAPATTPAAEIAEAPRPVVYVTGRRVNMRAGPSTGTAVILSLGFGAEAEQIGDVTDGWVQIRDLASDQTGYMAERFLSADRP